jgi:hypothetical protein
MCILKPECQRCETCGVLKYQLWAGPEMHDRGCPWGHETMDRCPDAINQAKLTYFCLHNGVTVTERGKAFVEQMEAIGVDLSAPAEDWAPEGAPAW